MAGHGCYLSGTRIRVEGGRIEGRDVAVDRLRAADKVVVIRDGLPALEPVRWVGTSSVDLSRHAHVEEAAPIRIHPHALGEQEPVRDLWLSPEHCLILDGLCVPVKLLVNGGSITSERNHPPFTYFHIELDRHGILLAENVAAESYLDTGNRDLFDNGGQPQQLHPVFTVNAGSARWLTDACAPLAVSVQEVEPIWRRLAERSALLGFAEPVTGCVEDPGLHLLADGRMIEATSDRDFRYTFIVPGGVEAVSINSRFCIPADRMIAGQRDTRRLGVRVNWIAIRSGAADVVVPADHPELRVGWNDVERDARSIWRWTDGAANIPWERFAAAAIVTIRCTPAEGYPLDDQEPRLLAAG